MRVWLLLLMVLLVPPPALAEKRVALIIGNGAYRAAPDLANPVADADAMARALDRLGFEVVRGTDLDISGMRRTIRRFSQTLDGADMALFFYAGHGVQVSGSNYMLPVDADLERESDLDFAAIDVRLVMRQMERAARTKIVLLDACRNNPFRSALSSTMGSSRSVSALGRGLAPIKAEGGALIGFATDPGDIALDGDGRHSPFTTALLEHIETPGLEINVLMTRVRADVYARTNQRQRPWTTSSLIGEVYLNESAPVAAPAPAQETGLQLELAFWSAIADSENAADYEAYLQQFPTGTFAQLARNRLTALAPEPSAPKPPREPQVWAGAGTEDTAEDTLAALQAPSDEAPITGGAAPEAPAAQPPVQAFPAALPTPEPEPDTAITTARAPTPRPPVTPAPVLPTQTAGHRDCAHCPEMIAVPGGTFRMGSDRGEPAERPARVVTVAPFLMARHEISVNQFSKLQGAPGVVWEANTGCYAWTRRGKMRFQEGLTYWDADYWSEEIQAAWTDRNRVGLPVACVRFSEALMYIDWLNAQVEGTPYRLPSEAEFEYALRAGSTSAYPWGDDPALACAHANAADGASRFRWRNAACQDPSADIALSGTLPANAFGLLDLSGNLWEWTADCWNGSHKGAPSDATARRKGNCRSRVVRGGSWDDPVENLRSAYRVGIPASRRQINVGFRVVRDPL